MSVMFMECLRLMKVIDIQLSCPICKGTAEFYISYCPSGRRLFRIGCDTKNCPNNITNSPVHDSRASALKSWNSRKWDGHHRRDKPPDTNTLELPFGVEKEGEKYA